MTQPDTPQTTLDSALSLAAQGFYVFPVIPNGKLPAIGGWPQRATRDPAQIRAWWVETDPVLSIDRTKEYNVGICTTKFGDDKHLIVVDADIKGGGPATIERLDMMEATDDWLTTLRASTPSGGFHLFFTAGKPLATTAKRVGPGVDTRGVDGFVVAAGSSINGKSYTWAGGQIRAVPDWLQERIGTPTPRKQGDNVVALLDMQPALDRAEAWLKEAAPLALEGQGGDHLTFTVAAKVKDFGVSELAALNLMLEHWNARCEPPWDYEALAVKVSNAYSYGKDAIGSASPLDFEPYVEEPRKPSVFTRPIDFAGRTPPIREWLAEGLIPRKKVTLLSGDGGVGKTLALQQLGTAAATGTKWFGREVIQGPVLLLPSEDDTEEMWRRQVDVCEAMGAPFENLQNMNWWTADDLAEGCVLMNFTRDNPSGALTGFAKKLREAIGDLKPVMVGVDPVANFYGGNELDRAQVTGFVNRVFNRLCIEFDTTFLVLTHPSVSGMAEGSGRSGSTAWANAVRSRLYLTRPEGDADGDMRVLKTTKANYGKMGEGTLLQWSRGAFHVAQDENGQPADPEKAADMAMLSALWELKRRGELVSPSKNASNYGPKRALRMPNGKGFGLIGLEKALDRLMSRGLVDLQDVRKSGRVISVLVVKGKEENGDEYRKPEGEEF